MLTVGISTSSGQFALAIGESNRLLFDSSESGSRSGELDELLLDGLACCKKEVGDIGHIIVDTGPGGTSRVRTGVAFANSLAYSLGISVSPVSSMELAGIDAFDQYGLPVVNSVKSIKGNAYIGLFDSHHVSIQYGNIIDVVPVMVYDIDRFVVVGFHREAIMQIPSLQNKTMTDSGMLFGRVKYLIEKSDYFSMQKFDFPLYAQPITEKTL